LQIQCRAGKQHPAALFCEIKATGQNPALAPAGQTPALQNPSVRKKWDLAVRPPETPRLVAQMGDGLYTIVRLSLARTAGTCGVNRRPSVAQQCTSVVGAPPPPPIITDPRMCPRRSIHPAPRQSRPQPAEDRFQSVAHAPVPQRSSATIAGVRPSTGRHADVSPTHLGAANQPVDPSPMSRRIPAPPSSARFGPLKLGRQLNARPKPGRPVTCATNAATRCSWTGFASQN